MFAGDGENSHAPASLKTTQSEAEVFSLRFPPSEMNQWSVRYHDFYDDKVAEEIAVVARPKGYLTLDQFLLLAKWKTPRSQSRCRKNSESYVQHVTGTAFAAEDPRFKIEVLRLLDGVEWPTASVLLHFCDSEPWPILDYRALWSLSHAVEPHQHGFPLWEQYVAFTRTLADEHGMTMRQIDRALWAYSKVNQT